MTEPATRVARVCSLLNSAEARYVIVGATAMQLWGTSRSTRDVDVLIEPTLENASRVLDALARLPFGVATELTPDEILKRGVTMIGDMPNVDVLTRAWNVQWPEASRSIAVFEVEGIPIPTASLETLIASKRTGRPQDTADILVLEAMLHARDQA
jgi:predicted nucleotidyltransferase